MMIFSILSALVQMYMLLIGIRILLSWFGMNHPGTSFLGVIVDPYLNLFRGIKFLRTRHLDLTPIAAVAFLQIANFIFFNLSYRSEFPGPKELFFFFLALLWSFVSFILGLFIILSLVRLLGFFFSALSRFPIWHALDIILMPPITKLGAILRKGFLTYRTGLLLFIFFLILTYVAGEWLLRWIYISF